MKSAAWRMLERIVNDAELRDALIVQMQGKHEFTENGCWNWTGSHDGNGYGRIKFRQVVLAAHRASYAIRHQTNPRELLVCHHCDNPRCINPDHLFLGTDADNTADKMRKGRHRNGPPLKGENNPRAKLTITQVDAIKALILKGWTNKAIAERYGVTHGAVSLIRRGKSWGGEAIGKPYQSLKAGAFNG